MLCPDAQSVTECRACRGGVRAASRGAARAAGVYALRHGVPRVRADAAGAYALYHGGVPTSGLAAGIAEQMFAAALRVWTPDCRLALLTCCELADLACLPCW